MPFVFRSIDHMRAVIDGPIGDEMLEGLRARPTDRPGLEDGGARAMYTKKPMHKPADLAGQKVRMMGDPLFVDHERDGRQRHRDGLRRGLHRAARPA